MKKIFEFLKLFLFFITGYFFFSLIVSGIEIILLLSLSDSTISYTTLFIRNIKDSLPIYTYIFITLFIFNFICNFIFVKLLNKKLNQFKRKDDFYEK